jgi:hypothetical protein
MYLTTDPHMKSSEQPKLAARLWDKATHIFPAALLLVYLAQFSAFLIAIGGFEPYVRLMDFMPTLAAAQLIVEGRGTSLYDLGAQHEVEARVLYPYKSLAAGAVLPYIHPPFEAMMIVPFISQSYVAVTLYWTIMTLIALAAAFAILLHLLPIRRSWLLVIFALSYQPVFRAFILGQNSTLVLLGICIAFAACRRKGIKWDAFIGAGLVLVALKPQIAPVIMLMILFEGRWRALLWFGAEIGLLSLLAMPLLGVIWPLKYLALLLGSQLSSNAAISPAIMHNWRGFVIDTVGSIVPSSVAILVVVMTALSIILFLYAWWNAYRYQNIIAPKPLSDLNDSSREYARDLLWALGVITAILISPHLFPHDLVLLIFPSWIIVYIIQRGLLSQKQKAVWLYLLAGLYLIMPLSFFIQANSPIWVILDVSALAFSTWLLLITIQATQRRSGYDKSIYSGGL